MFLFNYLTKLIINIIIITSTIPIATYKSILLPKELLLLISTVVF